MALEDATNPMRGVSGPGSYAKRTDLAYQPDAYGDGVAYAANKGAAPLETARKSPMLSQAPTVSGNAGAQQTTVGLFDPSQRPGEPVTHGIDVGAGAGSDALMMKSQFAQEKLSNTLAQMLPYDQTGEIGILYQQALSRGM